MAAKLSTAWHSTANVTSSHGFATSDGGPWRNNHLAGALPVQITRKAMPAARHVAPSCCDRDVGRCKPKNWDCADWEVFVVTLKIQGYRCLSQSQAWPQHFERKTKLLEPSLPVSPSRWGYSRSKSQKPFISVICRRSVGCIRQLWSVNVLASFTRVNVDFSKAQQLVMLR